MSQPLYLLDTSPLLFLVRGGALGQKINDTFGLAELKNRSLISVVTQGEIRVLAEIRDWGGRKAQSLQTALDNLVTVDVNHPDVIDAYVEIDIFSRRLKSGARTMGKNDLWIAACAKASGAELITLDKDFEHLSDLLTVHLVETALH